VVLAFAVARRTQEFGIRLALGATRLDVLRLVLGRAVTMVTKGVALTLPLTFWVIWLFAAQLFGVTDTDPLTFVWSTGVVVAAAAAAAVAPAWRATRIDPTKALRQE
jgi:putative ABC transport system permease protein